MGMEFPVPWDSHVNPIGMGTRIYQKWEWEWKQYTFVHSSRQSVHIMYKVPVSTTPYQSFCRAHDRNRPTDRQTDHATPSVTIGRIYLRSIGLLRCDLKSDTVYARPQLCKNVATFFTPGLTSKFVMLNIPPHLGRVATLRLHREVSGAFVRSRYSNGPWRQPVYVLDIISLMIVFRCRSTLKAKFHYAI